MPLRTYRAAGTVVAPAALTPFLVISSALRRVVRVTKIIISGPTLTTAAFQRLSVVKYSTLATGGTPVNVTKVPIDSLSVPSLAVIKHYTAAPTAGTPVGTLSERTVLAQSSTVVASAALDQGEFNFTGGEINTEFPTLRGAAEQIGVLFSVAPASAVTLSYTIEYTEDGN